MIGIVADYSAGYPGAAALRAAGFVGAVRYIGLGSSGKRATAVEVRDYAAHGLTMWCVAESTTTEANNGYAAGVNDARVAEADRIGLGLPDGTVIFAANDQPAYSAADVDYVRGFRDVLGVGRTGAYGFWDFLASVHSAGYASAYWQAGHPPGLTGTAGFVNLWQRQGTWGTAADGPGTPTTVTVNGVICDINSQYLPIGGDMPLTQADLDAIWNYPISNPNLPTAAPVVAKLLLTFGDEAAWAALAAAQGADADTKAGVAQLLVAVHSQPTGGQVDVQALATALVPLLSAADAQSLLDALKAQLNK